MSITLKAARMNMGYDQTTASQLIGISVDTLSNYERGKTFPDVPTIKKIEEVYNVKYDDINFLLDNYENIVKWMRHGTKKRGDEMMEQISQEEADRLIEEGKEETRKILNEGGKVIDTIIYEKDKVTTIRKIKQVNGESTSSKTVTTKDGITVSSF